MAIVWKVNGTDAATLGLEQLALELVNQRADRFFFSCALENDPGYALNAAIVLTRTDGAGDPVTWFRGRLRSAPRRLTPSSETLAFEVLGPWHWLERTPYLQSWKTPDDPDDVASTLVTYLRGRAILNQNTSGAKITAKVFIEEVLDYAIAACTTANGGVAPFARDVDASLAVTLPWDEVTDLSCADAINRVLSMLPDTVAWVDYAPTTPVIHLSRRGELAALEIPVLPPGDSSDFAHATRGEIDLAPLPEQQRSKVVLIYVQTHRANEAAWETYTIDDYPDASAPNDPDALVRTIQLAGGVSQSNVLQQYVNVDPLETYLEASGVVADGGTFDSLKDWWKRHARELRGAGITIKAFSDCEGRKADGSILDEDSPDSELVEGAITDWMEEKYDIVTEAQIVRATVWLEKADPLNSGRVSRTKVQLVANITATNAATKTYAFTESSSATPPEEVPTGLAQQIHAAVSVLHYEGTVVLTEAEPTVNTLVGRKLSLTGDLAAWETMDALVQSAKISLDDGSTALRVGPPRHLGVGDLVDLFRSNRTRRPVTGFETRTTGRSGSAGGRLGLAVHFPAAQISAAAVIGPRRFTAACTMAGVVPTEDELSDAIESVYDYEVGDGPNIPHEGDAITLTFSGVPKLRYEITLTALATSGTRIISIWVQGVTYRAFRNQSGLF